MSINVTYTYLVGGAEQTLNLPPLSILWKLAVLRLPMSLMAVSDHAADEVHKVDGLSSSCNQPECGRG